MYAIYIMEKLSLDRGQCYWGTTHLSHLRMCAALKNICCKTFFENHLVCISHWYYTKYWTKKAFWALGRRYGVLAYFSDIFIFARNENIGKICKRNITWTDFSWTRTPLTQNDCFLWLRLSWHFPTIKKTVKKGCQTYLYLDGYH